AFISGLRGDAKTSDDTSAISLLPQSSTNPINSSTSVSIKPANARAIGISLTPKADCVQTGLAQACDGVISVNTPLTDVNGGSYSLKAVVQHEIDEVLGLGSFVGFSTAPLPHDLFRYDQSGARTYSSSS